MIHMVQPLNFLKYLHTVIRIKPIFFNLCYLGNSSQGGNQYKFRLLSIDQPNSDMAYSQVFNARYLMAKHLIL